MTDKSKTETTNNKCLKENIEIDKLWEFLRFELKKIFDVDFDSEIWRIILNEGIAKAFEKICAEMFIRNIESPHADFIRAFSIALKIPADFTFIIKPKLRRVFLAWITPLQKNADTSPKKADNRKLIIMLSDSGMTNEEISQLTGYRENSIYKILYNFKNEIYSKTPRAAATASSRKPKKKLKRKKETARQNLTKNEILLLDLPDLTNYQRYYLTKLSIKKKIWSRKELGFIVMNRLQVEEQIQKWNKKKAEQTARTQANQ